MKFKLFTVPEDALERDDCEKAGCHIGETVVAGLSLDPKEGRGYICSHCGAAYTDRTRRLPSYAPNSDEVRIHTRWLE